MMKNYVTPAIKVAQLNDEGCSMLMESNFSVDGTQRGAKQAIYVNGEDALSKRNSVWQNIDDDEE